MRNSLVLMLALTLFYFFLKVESGDHGCSIFCICDVWFGLKRATCSNKRLYSIETGISTTVEAIDLSNNSISSLANYELAAAGLTKLRFLNLSGNGINEIGLAAFAKLVELAVLDLSQNHLNYILRDTYVQNTKLRILKIQMNNFNIHFPILQSPSITDLDLSGCFISHLPAGAFNGLDKLETLNLAKNVLIQISIMNLQGVPSLRSISLERNPWSCNRVMEETQSYLRSRKIKFIPVCDLIEPKEFEKMINLETVKQSPDSRLARIEKTIHSDISLDLDLWNEKTEENLKTLSAMNISQNFNNLTTSVDNTEPCWFLGIGFLLGSATTMIVIYLWFYASLTCRVLRSQRQNNVETNTTSQRVSLLRNLWLHQETEVDSTAPQICPGTPPPPYREVMLHRNLYPCAQ